MTQKLFTYVVGYCGDCPAFGKSEGRCHLSSYAHPPEDPDSGIGDDCPLEDY